MSVNNITDKENPKWDDFISSEVQNFHDDLKKDLSEKFNTVILESKKSREWYWEKTKSKKFWSILIRAISFILLILGAVLPILAGISTEPTDSLRLTQFGVASLAAAGLLHSADRIFGWSSGWLRYVSTVTEMESLTLKFRLDWTACIISYEEGDQKIKHKLFELSENFSKSIKDLQRQETEKWATEYNQNTALLGDLINSQRKSAEKAQEEVKKVIKSKEEKIEKQKQEEEKLKKLGSKGYLQIKIEYSDAPVPVTIKIDGDKEEVNFYGVSWVKKDLELGMHTVTLSYGDPEVIAQEAVEIKPSAISSIIFKV